jgi:hypothetical protein
MDIVSAYGALTSNLIDTRFGKWTHNQSYQGKAYYGYALCKVTIDSDFSPVLVNNKSFVGETEMYLTKNKIDFINDSGIGKAEVIKGVWFFPEKIVKPFEKICNELHEKKQQVTGMKRSVIKDVLASIWAKRIAVDNNGDMGDMFCSPDGVNVESDSQLEIAKFVYEQTKHGFSVGDVVVDGVKLIPTSDSLLQLSPNDRAMGSWKLSSHSPAFILGSGASAVKGKETVNELSINYDWLMKQIQDNPEAKQYVLTKTTCRTLGDALQDYNSWEELGKLITTERKLNFNETKREYENLPECGKDLLNQYTSLPLDINQVLSSEILEDIEEDETEYPE